ncbi:hypothetical protein JPSP40_23780 [Staphylococcus pseudintermedius]
MKKINYGIIGAGYFGKELGRIIANIEDAKVVSVYDIEKSNSERLAEEINSNFDLALEDI